MVLWEHKNPERRFIEAFFHDIFLTTNRFHHLLESKADTAPQSFFLKMPPYTKHSRQETTISLAHHCKRLQTNRQQSHGRELKHWETLYYAQPTTILRTKCYPKQKTIITENQTKFSKTFCKPLKINELTFINSTKVIQKIFSWIILYIFAKEIKEIHLIDILTNTTFTWFGKTHLPNERKCE